MGRNTIHAKEYSFILNQDRFHRRHKQGQQTKEILKILRAKSGLPSSRTSTSDSISNRSKSAVSSLASEKISTPPAVQEQAEAAQNRLVITTPPPPPTPENVVP